ncbi:AAA family ATPase [Spirosoma endophyticum]|uniref:ATPase/GTPase, AAA15 family n=1 Tax=Spirosoma endophyticum TaxID=662367 RepID=A0A1I1INE7_9BACT|nr:AAA family ATPase [Spirosoma endophyticum]SFC37754.1 ATPase/GTPase, AAA15 family [Spirosoma endophyticum]
MENTTSNTNNFLNWVEIKNFKSIKDLRLDCKRVNVFIGKPNVGKSNILEGLGLLGAGYDTDKFLRGAVRYSNLRHLFLDNDINLPIEITTDLQKINIGIIPSMSVKVNGKVSTSPTEYLIVGGNKESRIIDEQGYPSKISKSANPKDEKNFGEQFRKVKKYDFANLTEFINPYQDFLLPPNGPNLYEVVRRNRELWNEFAKLFTEQKLELVLFDEEQKFILQKKDGPYIWQYPYFSIADTFRRFMFYITAIESNKNSILVFEEPEVHSFPPYVKALAHRIVYSETNQFFVSTHSPYLLQTLIRELAEAELTVFITYYKDYQTCVRKLTSEELQEAEDLGIDLFYNLSRYEPNA